MNEINLISSLERPSHGQLHNQNQPKKERSLNEYSILLNRSWITVHLLLALGCLVQPHPEFLLLKCFFQASRCSKKMTSDVVPAQRATISPSPIGTCFWVMTVPSSYLPNCNPGLALDCITSDKPIWILFGRSVIIPPLLLCLQGFLSGFVFFFLCFQIHWRGWRIKG